MRWTFRKKGLHKPIDGVSLLPYLSGEKSGNPHEALFWRKMDTRAIRSGSYKLIITRGVDSVLYNMDQDVEEMHDLLSSEPEKARELMEQLSEWGAGLLQRSPLDRRGLGRNHKRPA